jgi:hypothetical protein
VAIPLDDRGPLGGEPATTDPSRHAFDGVAPSTTSARASPSRAAAQGHGRRATAAARTGTEPGARSGRRPPLPPVAFWLADERRTDRAQPVQLSSIVGTGPARSRAGPFVAGAPTVVSAMSRQPTHTQTMACARHAGAHLPRFLLRPDQGSAKAN